MTVDFNDYFWGEKNNGFDVLYHNMKFGLVASKELSEFFREKSNIEEQNSKMMSKLAHKASTGTLNSTFAPVWTILRTSAEKLSTLHMQMVQKLTELVKDVAKYADELHKKHKMVKEEESQTLECVQAMQASTTSVQKSRDVYTSKVLELEKLRKENGSQKDIEKIETKLKKLQEEYKTLLDKHNPIKSDFERRMTQTCKRFQEIEEMHLRQMKEFLSTYLELLQNNHDMVGQVHSDFKRQFLDMSVDKLLEQFVLNKYTGLEKPEVAELDFIPLSIQQNQQQSSSTSRLNHPSASATSSVAANNTNSNSASSIQGAIARITAGGSVSTDQRAEALSLGSGGSGSGSLLNADDSILGFTTTNATTPRPTSPALINASLTASPPQSVSSLQATVNLTTPPITSAAIAATSTTTSIAATTTTSTASSTTTIKSNFRNWFSSSIPSSKQNINSNTNAPQTSSSSGNFGMDSNGSTTGTTVTKNPPNSELQSLQDNNNQDEGQMHNVPSTPPLASTTAIPSLGCRKFSEQFSTSLNERGNHHHQLHHHHHHFHHHANANTSSSSASASSSTTTTSTSAMNAANSRRTTSLLNIFTSNSQVSGILRSRRDKAKTKKSKKKKDDENSENIQEERLASVERANNAGDHSLATGREQQNSKLKMPLNSSGSGSGAGLAASSASASGSVDSTGGGQGGMSAVAAIDASGSGGSSNANTSGSSSATAAGIANTGGLKVANNSGGSGGGAYKTTDVDEDGYSIQPPKEIAWEEHKANTGSFYSDSDSDSDNDKPERRIHVKIKPLNNGQAPMSASVDELRATVENISLSPTGVFSHSQQLQNSRIPSRQQSPEISNASTPTASVHPYAPLQSPTLSMSNNSRYADLGDIFSELGDMSASAPTSATLSKSNSRQIPTPTSANSIAIPRPPSRRSEMMVAAATAAAGGRGRNSPSTQMNRAESVGSLEFRPNIGGCMGSSRGPSPLTIGISETIPLAVAFHEIIHAFFRGNDESRCQVKISGDMMISFPAGIAGLLANNPNPAKLGFRIKNFQNLENFIPNAKLVQIDKNQSSAFSTLLEFNMAALTAVLRRQAEHNPNASYFNVDILKYQVRTKPGASSCPFQLVSYWKCEPNFTALKIDYKYNNHAMASASPLLNVTLSVPVSGSVRNVQSKPHSAWLGESNRLVWNFTDISQNSQDGGVGTLRARLELNDGPSQPALLNTQFNCEGTTLSGIEFELQGSGYRISLVKRRFVSGKYVCEGDGVRSCVTPTPTSIGSTSPY